MAKIYSTKTVITRFVNKVAAVMGENLLARDNSFRDTPVGDVLDLLMQEDYAAQPTVVEEVEGV